MSDQAKSFSPMRAYFWPIYSHELRKFLPLLLLAFFISFNYGILKNVKEAPLVTAKASGAEVLPFIKVWGILPGALMMTFIYSRLNNHLSRDRVFYAMIAIFLLFFTVFTFFIYPHSEKLYLHETADWLESVLPRGFKGLIAMFRYWTLSSFYVMSELWSSSILSMLFWGFANEITKWGEARRFYGLIAIGLNLATIFAGQVSALFSRVNPAQSDPWGHTLVSLTGVVVFSGLAIMALYRFISRQAMSEGWDRNSHRKSAQSTDKEAIRMSLRENFAYLARSKYLLCIAVVVLAYNLVINLTEVIWKDQVKQLYPGPNEYNAFMSMVMTITGTISFLTSVFLSGQLIRKLGWTVVAMATPLILLVTSIGFFGFLFLSNHGAGIWLFGLSPLVVAVLFGAAQNCLSRASKYTLFDATKEMAFIPLNLESKLKGKAAIDGVGSRLGKSGGSLIHQGLLIIFSSFAASLPFVAVFLLAVIGLWMSSVFSLGKGFQKLTASPPESTEPKEPAEATEAKAEDKELLSV